MSRLLIIVLVHTCLTLKISCYNYVHSKTRRMLSDDLVTGMNQPHTRYSANDELYDILNDYIELRGNNRVKFGDGDLRKGAHGEEDEQLNYQQMPVGNMIDHTYHLADRHNADPGCSKKLHGASNTCCKKYKGCKYYPLCGGYYLPPKTMKSMPTARGPTLNQSNWMAKHEGKKLHDIIMPGSHHAGINVKPDAWTKWGIPQAMSVANQLKAGIRFMDVRVATAPSLSQPTIVHTFKYGSFKNLIRAVVRFLKKYRSEVVVLRVIGPNGLLVKWSVNWSKVDGVLEKYAKYIHKEKNPMEMKLSDLGGKMIICQDSSKSKFKSLTCLGSFSKTKTSNPSKLPSKMMKWLKSKKKPTTTFRFLEAICTVDKSDVINSLVKGFTCKRDGKQLLKSYTSLEQLAADCNYKVYDWLKKNSPNASKKLNSVMTDFVNPKITNYIINSN